MARRMALMVFCALGMAAAEHDANWDPRFRGLDRNGDGVVNRNEWRGNYRTFQQHDGNNDGMISGDELTGRRQQNRGTSDREADSRSQRFERLDRNNDLRVESHEWPYNQQVFRRLDRDNNGHLTSDEY